MLLCSYCLLSCLGLFLGSVKVVLFQRLFHNCASGLRLCVRCVGSCCVVSSRCVLSLLIQQSSCAWRCTFPDSTRWSAVSRSTVRTHLVLRRVVLDSASPGSTGWGVLPRCVLSGSVSNALWCAARYVPRQYTVCCAASKRTALAHSAKLCVVRCNTFPDSTRGGVLSWDVLSVHVQ